MKDKDTLQRFWEATLGEQPVDHEAFLAEGDTEVSDAVRAHKLILSAAKAHSRPTGPYELGRFQVLGDLGAGGMGRVYLGWDPDLRREVAIKVIARDRWAINEARAIASLDHRSIVKVHEVGRDRVVMELLDGGSLQEKLAEIRDGAPSFLEPLRARLHCLVRIAEGLAYCHERGILHRDVKPGNVLFARDDEHPRLVDFGLAHLDELESLDITQNLVGSPAYLAPEQIAAGETGTDQRSDIFSFGVLAYELLTLESPFARETRTATLEAVTAAHPRRARGINSEIPRAVTHIMDHCLERDPGRRYPSMQQVVRDLQDALASRPISVGGRHPLRRLQLYFQRNRLAAGFSTAGVGLAALVSVGLWLTSMSISRTDFKREIESVRRRLPELHTPAALHAAGLDLFTAQSRARELNASWIGKRLIQDSEPLVTAACDEWSRHLSEELEAIQSFETGGHPPDNWRPLVDLDARLSPEAEWNLELRNRGAVLLMGDLESRRAELVTYRQVALGAGELLFHRVWKRTPLAKFPQIGFYRVELPGVWQSEFLLASPWGEPVALELPRRRLDTTDWIAWDSGGYLVSPLVSNSQYEDYCEEMGIAPDLIGQPEQAAMVSHEQAMSFAAWAGGRLPMVQELATLCEVEAIAGQSLLEAEFVSDLPPIGGITACSYFQYARWESHRGGTPSQWLSVRSRDDILRDKRNIDGYRIGATCGFRIFCLPH